MDGQSDTDHPDPALMEQAIDRGLAERAVGVLVVADGEIVAASTGAIFDRPDATAHSEVEAIREACVARDSERLPDAWLYTTHEPCPMCTAAACWAGMAGIVYAVAHDEMPAAWGEQAFETPATHLLEASNHDLELHADVCRERALRIPERD